MLSISIIKGQREPNNYPVFPRFCTPPKAQLPENGRNYPAITKQLPRPQTQLPGDFQAFCPPQGAPDLPPWLPKASGKGAPESLRRILTSLSQTGVILTLNFEGPVSKMPRPGRDTAH